MWMLLWGWLPFTPGPGGVSTWRSLSVPELGVGIAAVLSLGAALVWGGLAADAAWANANRGKSFEETMELLRVQRERQGRAAGTECAEEKGD